ncbi:MAG: OB-fold domain-containing protein [Ornithinimicrobium sp.]|uniref:Zn-ribbon domain-containing OB-fold protein n=1 Tax=Ornithinimicrobium sp. TaxID=1977084 RepID=UPI0026E091E8|nr:OB-fold domain-containing protein [Ornithinimicrobium sp.]MDO5740186.1 OB-fold domain-containing protein [Ornithinimicrobium sp.]
MSRPPFPGPTSTPISEPFWAGVDDERLMFQRCSACERAIFPARGHCPGCWSQDLVWQESTGRGTLASFAAVHRPGHAAFTDLTPYTLALVDLEEGFRMLSRLVEASDSTPTLGSSVEVSWRMQGETRLPLFTVKENS